MFHYEILFSFLIIEHVKQIYRYMYITACLTLKIFLMKQFYKHCKVHKPSATKYAVIFIIFQCIFFIKHYMKYGESEQCSKSKVRRKNTKQEQSKHNHRLLQKLKVGSGARRRKHLVTPTVCSLSCSRRRENPKIVP